MDKQGSHTNQPTQNNDQGNPDGMSTHGEIHKDTMTGGTASVSLNSGLTSALSRAPSPFSERKEPVIETPHQSQEPSGTDMPHMSEGPERSDGANMSPEPAHQADDRAPIYPNTHSPEAVSSEGLHERQEPYFGQNTAPASQEPYGEDPHHPSMDDIYAQEHNYDASADREHAHREAAPYPAQYQNYHDDMHDAMDEAAEKPHSRRTSFLLLSALALIAIIAGGVIYFYKSSTTQEASNKEVPVVKVENEPTKITPEKPGGIEIPHQKKLIYDRITGENTESSEQIVSREEAVTPITPAQTPQQQAAPASGNPFDQQASQSANSADAPVTAPSGAEPIAKAQLPPGVTLPANQQIPNVEVQTTTPVAISPPPVAPSTPSAAAQSATGGDYLIQIASFRSQEEAVRNYENLNRKYAGLLSSYGPMIQRADLGSRGIYYRLRIGPMDTKETATNLCANLLAQGQKDCLVRRK